MKKFPKILIVGINTFEENNATSITLANIFEGYPVECVAFLLCSYSVQEPTGYSYYYADQVLFSKLSNKASVRKLSSYSSLVSGTIGATSVSSFKSRFLNYIHTIASAYRSLIPLKYNKETKKFIKSFSPDVIYTLGASIGVNKLCLKISRDFNIPIVPHIMDDWMSTKYSSGLFLKYPRYILTRSFKSLIKKSRFGYAICDKMSREYEQRYGLNFYSLMNCVDQVSYNINYSTDSSKPVAFLYSGGLHLMREKSLFLLLDAIHTLGIKCVFSLCCSEKDWNQNYKQFSKYAFVKYKGYLSKEDLDNEVNKSDVLVHIESFQPTVKQYTKYSISTKIPEYLASGKLILAIGPDDIASIQYLSENNCALVITEQNIDCISGCLKNLFKKDLVIKLINNSLHLCRSKHIKDVQHKLLFDTLETLILDI